MYYVTLNHQGVAPTMVDASGCDASCAAGGGVCCKDPTRGPGATAACFGAAKCADIKVGIPSYQGQTWAVRLSEGDGIAAEGAELLWRSNSSECWTLAAGVDAFGGDVLCLYETTGDAQGRGSYNAVERHDVSTGKVVGQLGAFPTDFVVNNNCAGYIASDGDQGTFYAQLAKLDGGEGYIMALDLATGNVSSSPRLDDAVLACACDDGGSCYAMSRKNEFGLLDMRSGELKVVGDPAQYEAYTFIDCGMAAGDIYLTTGQKKGTTPWMIATDVKSGLVLWEFELAGIFADVVVVRAAAGVAQSRMRNMPRAAAVVSA